MLTRRSKVAEIANLDGIIELLKKHTGQDVSPSMLKVAGMMNLQSAARSMGWPEEALDAMIKEANEALVKG